MRYQYEELQCFNPHLYPSVEEFDRVPRLCLAPTKQKTRCRWTIDDSELAEARKLRRRAQSLPDGVERDDAIEEFILLRCCDRWHRDKLGADKTGCLKLLVKRYGAQFGRRSSEYVYAEEVQVEAMSNLTTLLDYGTQRSYQNTGMQLRSRTIGSSSLIRSRAPYFVPYKSDPRDSIFQDLLLDIPWDMPAYGEVYSFTWPPHPGFSKIGYSGHSAMRRVEDWQTCHAGATLSHAAKVEYPQRIERLVHLQLAQYRYRIIICTACSRGHEEWFKMASREVNQVITDWTDLTRREPLYGRDRRLTSRWRNRITTFSGIITARGLHDLLDDEEALERQRQRRLVVQAQPVVPQPATRLVPTVLPPTPSPAPTRWISPVQAPPPTVYVPPTPPAVPTVFSPPVQSAVPTVFATPTHFAPPTVYMPPKQAPPPPGFFQPTQDPPPTMFAPAALSPAPTVFIPQPAAAPPPPAFSQSAQVPHPRGFAQPAQAPPTLPTPPARAPLPTVAEVTHELLMAKIADLEARIAHLIATRAPPGPVLPAAKAILPATKAAHPRREPALTPIEAVPIVPAVEPVIPVLAEPVLASVKRALPTIEPVTTTKEAGTPIIGPAQLGSEPASAATEPPIRTSAFALTPPKPASTPTEAAEPATELAPLTPEPIVPGPAEDTVETIAGDIAVAVAAAAAATTTTPSADTADTQKDLILDFFEDFMQTLNRQYLDWMPPTTEVNVEVYALEASVPASVVARTVIAVTA